MSDSRDLVRARMSVRRDELSARQRVEAAAGVLHSLEALPEFMTDRNVAGYWAIRGELPLNLAVTSLRRRDQHYFLPLLGDGLRTARDMGVVLLPLLAFDRHGHRLGTGGGWDDTSLAFLRGAARPASPLLVGIGYTFQEVESVPAEPWDVGLDYIATDSELIACGATGQPS